MSDPMSELPSLYKVITLQNLHSLYIQSYQIQEKEFIFDLDKLRSNINANPLIDPSYDLLKIDPQKDSQRGSQSNQMISGEQIVEIINEFFGENGGQVLIPISTKVFKISETISINKIKDRLIKILNHYKNTTLREVAALESRYYSLRAEREKVIASEVLKDEVTESVDNVDDIHHEEKNNEKNDHKLDESNTGEVPEKIEKFAKGPSESELSGIGEFSNDKREEDNEEQKYVSQEGAEDYQEHKGAKNDEPVENLQENDNIEDRKNENEESKETTGPVIDEKNTEEETNFKKEHEASENSEATEAIENLEREKLPEEDDAVHSTPISETTPAGSSETNQQTLATNLREKQAKTEDAGDYNEKVSTGDASLKNEKSGNGTTEPSNAESNAEIAQGEDHIAKDSGKQEGKAEDVQVEKKKMDSSDEKSWLERESSKSPSKETERKRPHHVDETDQEKSPSKKQKKEDTQKSIKKFQTIASNLISQISSNRFASTFLAPVNKSEEPEYYKIVKQPQDLKTILKNCRNGVITTFDELTKVLQIMFTNAIIYNDEDSDVSKLTIEMMEETTKIIELFRESLD